MVKDHHNMLFGTRTQDTLAHLLLAEHGSNQSNELAFHLWLTRLNKSLKMGRCWGKTYSTLLTGQRKSTQGQTKEQWQYHFPSRTVGFKIRCLMHPIFPEELVFCSPLLLSLNWLTSLVQELRVRQGQTTVSQRSQVVRTSWMDGQ